MSEPYACPRCGEMLIKLETNLSKSGYQIPTNFFDGEITKRGENHKCPYGKAGGIKETRVYVNEKSHDLAEYMQRWSRLGQDGWWHGWRNGKYVGRVEKARKEDYASWEPKQEVNK